MKRRFLAGTTAALLALCAGSTAMANVRAAADIGLVGISPIWFGYYPGGLQMSWNWPGRTQLVRLEFGAEVTDNIGITAGAMLGESWGWDWNFYAVSGLPITARVYWDMTPEALWVRQTAYLSATYHHDFFYGDPHLPGWQPGLVLAAGSTYTYYAITGRAEIMASIGHSTDVALLFGVELGGSYIFGRHHESDMEF